MKSICWTRHKISAPLSAQHLYTICLVKKKDTRALPWQRKLKCTLFICLVFCFIDPNLSGFFCLSRLFYGICLKKDSVCAQLEAGMTVQL